MSRTTLRHRARRFFNFWTDKRSILAAREVGLTASKFQDIFALTIFNSTVERMNVKFELPHLNWPQMG
jgi:hypothetical protein